MHIVRSRGIIGRITTSLTTVHMRHRRTDYSRPLVWETKDQYIDRFAVMDETVEKIKSPINRRLVALRKWEEEAYGCKGLNGRFTRLPTASVRIVVDNKEYLVRDDDDLARYPIEDAPAFARGKLVGEEFY